MSYTDVVEGLHERFATIAGLKVVMLGEPASVDDDPLLYTVVGTGTRQTPGTLTRITYRSHHYLMISWEDPEMAERMLIGLINAVPAALNADPRLGGRAHNAEIVEWDADNPGWVDVGDLTVRLCVFVSEVLEMVPHDGTL